MSVPDFQAIMLPLLHLTEDGGEHTLAEAVGAIAAGFHLSPGDLAERLPSGKQSRFANRVGWAQTHLKKAGLLIQPGRGRFVITPRGAGVLAEHPSEITMASLMQFPEFVEFRRSASGVHGGGGPIVPPGVAELDPQEQLDRSYQGIRQVLAQDLLQKMKDCAPSFFERLVVDLLVKMGYGGSFKDAAQAVGQSGDGGVDGVIKEDRLGLDLVYLQAKRWQGTVGRPVVQGFAGSLEGFKAHKGVLITTSKFTPDAHDYVSHIGKRIVLISGEQLAQLMIDHGIGVTEVETYVVKRLDLDYFEDNG